jgi:hypothetical protein
MSSTQITVPFYGSNLSIIEHNGEPYTPMRPIVEGMGLAWQAQHRKLTSNSARWGVTMMVIPSLDKHNQVTCLPLRKLFGWLQTLQPNRIREDIRDTVLQYQNECDDVLWKHWSKQQSPIIPIEAPKHLRLLLNIENGQVVSSQPIPIDCCIFSLSEIPKLLNEPGYFSVNELKRISDIATMRITNIANEQSKLLNR